MCRWSILLQRRSPAPKMENSVRLGVAATRAGDHSVRAQKVEVSRYREIQHLRRQDTDTT